jgi:hypothetical protein
MKRFSTFFFLSALLISALACQPPSTPIYSPWEEGLTLAFEDPSQPQPQRSQNRLQIRVAKTSLAADKPALIQIDMSSLSGHLDLKLRLQAGGSTLLGETDQVISRILPEGFPSTTHWVERETEFTVIGRATWEGASILPATSDPIGIWVEARPVKGPRHRRLYLPNLGEVESLVEDRDGKWICVNRLVSRGFTDLPIRKRP